MVLRKTTAALDMYSQIDPQTVPRQDRQTDRQSSAPKGLTTNKAATLTSASYTRSHEATLEFKWLVIAYCTKACVSECTRAGMKSIGYFPRVWGTERKQSYSRVQTGK